MQKQKRIKGTPPPALDSGASRIKRITAAIIIIAVVALFVFSLDTHKRASAQDVVNTLGSLKSAPMPKPGSGIIGQFIKSGTDAKLVALGKAFFWDQQAGSDGVQACATCHFHAGADPRSRNQLGPGINAGDTNFEDSKGPDYQLTLADFPFHKLADPDDRFSVISDSNDVASSQGVFLSSFIDIVPGAPTDNDTPQADPVFFVGTSTVDNTVRRAEPRNTPTVINAGFNFRNFWDGRAQNDFNGVNPFGSRDKNAKVLKVVPLSANPNKSQLNEVGISINNSSLASQAVGPPLSDREMSAAGRSFRKLGKKLLSLRPLGLQQIAPDDSALAAFRHPSGRGLDTTYAQLIKDVFQNQWWDTSTTALKVVKLGSNGKPTFQATGSGPGGALTTDEFTAMEWNFSLFWGLAVQAYEFTLKADDSPFDRFMSGITSALTTEQQEGLAIFQGQGRCIACHDGPEMTNASVANVVNEPLERMIMGDDQIAVYDNGFYNIGVRPTADDLGVGGLDPFGNPLSMTKLNQQKVCASGINKETGLPNLIIMIPARPDEGISAGPLLCGERVAVRGNMKTPGLRNVELTAPYFHNGGQGTLRQVVEFYNRGGDFRELNEHDLDPDILNLFLTEEQKDKLVAFLISLTDERVRFHKAPFDHPSLLVPLGGSRSSPGATTVAAVGAGGYPAPFANFPNFP